VATMSKHLYEIAFGFCGRKVAGEVLSGFE
jgi:hypothetical protein